MWSTIIVSVIKSSFFIKFSGIMACFRVMERERGVGNANVTTATWAACATNVQKNTMKRVRMTLTSYAKVCTENDAHCTVGESLPAHL